MICFKRQIKHIALSFFLLICSHHVNADWQVIYQEDFESIKTVHKGQWQADYFPDHDQYSEAGRYFFLQSIHPPLAYRLATYFGQTGLSHSGWLVAESYTRDKETDPNVLLSIQEDPTNKNNKVLKLSSPSHTDATLIRSSEQLQGRYRMSLKVGFPNFGNGQGMNGYNGEESAEPWLQQSAINENGFYWLAIADTVPRPHNNIWWHHHRKVVVDSDNHYPAWTKIWDGQKFINSGENPIMIFVLDGNGKTDQHLGKPFISYSDKQWQQSGEIKAVDAYVDDQWYELVFERNNNLITITISGIFRYGGEQKYTAQLDIKENCVWHYNRVFDEKNSVCQRDSKTEYLTWPDYLFFGDPHINFYEGEVYYDDLRLEMWKKEE